MHPAPKYSVVVPVFNRSEELDELLQSLTQQTYRNFEVIVVDDGSKQRAEAVAAKYSNELPIRYFYKENSGPGPSRNFGFQHASGEFVVVFDSDCILPSTYFESVEKFFSHKPLDAWGGPDRGHEKFTDLQRAMAFTMSSVLTTGGIRGGKNQIEGFQPRSFNMGMSRAVIEKTGGFKFDRLAEDIELSIRMKQSGFRIGLIPEAYVYHKRRTALGEFFHQVKGFGKGRVRVGKVHSGEVKLTHWFPTAFMLGLIALPFLFLLDSKLGALAIMFFTLYLAGIFIDSLRVTKSMSVALLSIPSAVVQLCGYGWGFLREKMR